MTPLQNLQPKNPKFPWIYVFFAVGMGIVSMSEFPYWTPLRGESLILPSTDPPGSSESFGRRNRPWAVSNLKVVPPPASPLVVHDWWMEDGQPGMVRAMGWTGLQSFVFWDETKIWETWFEHKKMQILGEIRTWTSYAISPSSSSIFGRGGVNGSHCHEWIWIKLDPRSSIGRASIIHGHWFFCGVLFGWLDIFWCLDIDPPDIYNIYQF